MTQDMIQPVPRHYCHIQQATEVCGFTMSSDKMTCSLLRTLAASKPGGRFLELGTGTGLATSWILDGMDSHSSLVSIDNDSTSLDIARDFLGTDTRLELILTDGTEWLIKNRQSKFDYIFADTWHGKYLMLDDTLNMVNRGGFYIVDDMIPQANWPEGHHEKASNLVHYLDARTDFFLAKQAWATGIIVAVRR